jgi:DNA-binding MarR family transcriptional regulator
LTQLYEKELKPLGLGAAQFSVLQALELAGEVSQGRLGEILAMDSTTLTRALKIMAKRGWIAERRGEDRRERLLKLAEAGKTQLKRVLPAWEGVQSKLRIQLGEQVWEAVFQAANQLTSKVVETGGLQ